MKPGRIIGLNGLLGLAVMLSLGAGAPVWAGQTQGALLEESETAETEVAPGEGEEAEQGDGGAGILHSLPLAAQQPAAERDKPSAGSAKELPEVQAYQEDEFSELVKVMKFRVSKNLAAMSKHAMAHGVMEVTGPRQGYAVGFLTSPPGRGGFCSTSVSPAAVTEAGCQDALWISDKPGGLPLAGCLRESRVSGTGASVSWTVLGPGSAVPMPNRCVLK
ncbi:MAG: hypothetical protein NDI60_09200, partial [Elusimicrobiales bacterium]|nr:hypothetical protein [Elusimicrobiales bacterium]